MGLLKAARNFDIIKFSFELWISIDFDKYGKEAQMTDRVMLTLSAGDGGAGAVTFHREKYISHGGPDGGDGGRGGNVIVRVDKNANTLSFYKYKHKFNAEAGAPGTGGKRHGKDGEDCILPVPAGTVIRDSESGAVIHDMSDGEDYVICKGGRGGFGNRRFANSVRQIPRFAKSGTDGERRVVIFELKTIADVGIVGMPSVGKSTLLSKISGARPKIGDYDFTTLEPNLGVVAIPESEFEEKSEFIAADIPGLIEGAAEGAGLGHTFLRHIERCRLMIHLFDLSVNDCEIMIDNIKTIDSELERYGAGLDKIPQILCGNKKDALLEDTDLSPLLRYAAETNREITFISADERDGVKELVMMTAEKLKSLPGVRYYEPEFIAPEKKAEDYNFTITKSGDIYSVEGEWIKKMMGSVNFADRESLSWFERKLRAAGIFDALEEKGCGDGCTVTIYDFEFDYVE